jgi:hypothetical protein
LLPLKRKKIFNLEDTHLPQNNNNQVVQQLAKLIHTHTIVHQIADYQQLQQQRGDQT